MADRKYLSCAETAKLVRQSLKEAFPKVKFSVKSSTYSGGASIRAYWLDGEPVRFGSSFIFEERSYSDAQVQKAIDQVVGAMGGTEAISVEDYRMGRSYSWRNTGGVDMGRELNLALTDMTDQVPLESATRARVKFAGDDGYGEGTVGTDASGGNKAAKASSFQREVRS